MEEKNGGENILENVCSVSVHVVVPAAIAQLGERQTEDLKVPGSIPGGGNSFLVFFTTASNL